MGQYLLELLIVAAGSAVQATVGFGFALVSAPLLVLLDPALVPGPLTVGAAAVGGLNVYRNRKPVDWPGIRWASAGMVPGTILAGWTLSRVSAHALSVLVGVLVLVAVGISAAGLHAHRSPRTLTAAGLASGFMGTTATIGGPPIALLYQRESGALIRSTLARFFLLATVLAVAALIPAGRLGVDELRAGLSFYPGIAIGFLAARRLIGILDRGYTRWGVLGVSAVSSVAVLVRELL